MARRKVELITSDLTGTEIKDNEAAQVVVLRHPLISRPVRLDAQALEVASLEGTKRELVTIELTLPDTPSERLTLDRDVFDKLFRSGSVEDVLGSAATVGDDQEEEAPRRRGRPKGTGTKATSSSSTSSMSREQRDAIRTWANSNGYSVGDRGRIKAEIIDAFEAAHKS